MASMGHSQGGVAETLPQSPRALHGARANGNRQPTPWALAGASLPLPTSLCPVPSSWPLVVTLLPHAPYMCP